MNTHPAALRRMACGLAHGHRSKVETVSDGTGSGIVIEDGMIKEV